MTKADLIRKRAYEYYVLPAREQGRTRVTIRAGDLHDRMGLMSNMPAVCGAIGANRFQEDYQVRLVARECPTNGANVFFTFDV